MLLLFLSFSSIYSYGQIPEDALKMGWYKPGGTARNQAIGGVVGSLGGDLTSTFGNPAGLGFYKTSEVVLSPGYNFNTQKSDYRGTESSDKKNSFLLGTSGVVFGFSDRYKKGKSSAFSIAVSRTADFNSNIYYKGQNDFSSYGEQYAAEVAGSGLTLDQVLNSNSVSLGSRMGVYTYLVDTLTYSAGTEVISTATRHSLQSGAALALEQENSIETKGGITEIAFGFGTNKNDKLYFGGSLGIPIVNYESRKIFTERDISGNNNSDFSSSTLDETYKSKGVGLNLKLGMIFKPVDNLRLGLAVHTPSIYGLTDTYDATMSTNTENYANADTVSSKFFNNGETSEFEYDLTSPWRMMVSGSYIFSEIEDVTKQKGFISFDVEYVTYGSSRYKTANTDQADDGYYDGVNKAIKEINKGAFNFRLGGEMKFNTIMARLGFSYYGDPYKTAPQKANKMFVSGGVGYRNKGIFVDLTYVQGFQKDFNLPYLLTDKENVYASQKVTSGTAMLTFGFKF